MYRMYLDKRDNEVHEQLQARDTPASAPEAPRALEKRIYDGEIFCGCGWDLVPSDYDAAVANLESQFANWVNVDSGSYYAIQGAVVAFACNKGEGFWITASSYGVCIASVTDSCGEYVTGTYRQISGGDADIGCMQYSAGLDFCGDTENSPVDSC